MEQLTGSGMWYRRLSGVRGAGSPGFQGCLYHIQPCDFAYASSFNRMLALPRGETRGPQSPNRRPVLAQGLLGTKPHSRRWVEGEQVRLHLYLQLPLVPTLLLELCLLSDQRQQYILTGAPAPLRTVHARDLGCCSLWESNAWWSAAELRQWC